MKGLTLILLIVFASCASAPAVIPEGYVAGMVDSGVFDDKPGDSKSSADLKAASRKLADAAKKQIASGEKKAEELNKKIIDLEKELRWWRGWGTAGMAETGAALLFSIWIIWKRRK